MKQATSLMSGRRPDRQRSHFLWLEHESTGSDLIMSARPRSTSGIKPRTRREYGPSGASCKWKPNFRPILALVVLVATILSGRVDAFLSRQYPKRLGPLLDRGARIRRYRVLVHPPVPLQSSTVDQGETSPSVSSESPAPTRPFTHADVVWKIRPPPHVSRRQRWKWRLQTWLQGLLRPGRDALWYFETMGHLGMSQAVLHAYDRQTGQALGRFGLTTQTGPTTPALQQTIGELFGGDGEAARTNDDQYLLETTAAIIYMYVEPAFRGRGLGALALSVMGYLQGSGVDLATYKTLLLSGERRKVACDYVVLVADDKSDDGRLVQWYERHNFFRAPLLQETLGSPNGIYGVAMIGRTRSTLPSDCQIEWSW
jgi:GNAT superfamily N-acetyltransferase